jgi:hypothetical protein
MSFANLHKLVAYLLSGLGLVALSLGTELAPEVVGLMFAGFVGSYFAEGKLLAHPYYSRGWTALLAAVLVLQVMRAVSTEPTLAMPIEFAALLQLSKLWNRRTAVDYQHIAVLAFVHLIAATVLSTSLSYAIIFVGFVIATPWMLALSQLRREIEGNYPASAPDDEHAQAAVRRVLASRRVVLDEHRAPGCAVVRDDTRHLRGGAARGAGLFESAALARSARRRFWQHRGARWLRCDSRRPHGGVARDAIAEGR